MLEIIPAAADAGYSFAKANPLATVMVAAVVIGAYEGAQWLARQMPDLARAAQGAYAGMTAGQAAKTATIDGAAEPAA